MNKKVGVKTMSSLMFVLLLTKILGFIKIRLFASLFGLSRELDIFWAAFTVPDTIFNILVAGGFNAGILPVFSDVQEEEGNRGVSKLFFAILFWFSLLVIIISLLMFIFAPVVADFMVGKDGIRYLTGLTSNFSLSEEGLLIGLMRLMLLSPILLGISNILTIVLQLKRRFNYMMLAPLFYNLGIIVGARWLYGMGIGIWALAWAVVLGSALHLFSQIIFIIKEKGIHFYSDFRWPEILLLRARLKSWVKEILKLSIPRSLALLIEQVNVVVNTFISFTLSAGALSSYKFAYSLHLFPIHIIGSSISTVALPDLAESKSKKDQVLFVHNFNKALHQLLFLILPITTLTLVLRLPIVRLAYGTGKFDWWATVVTAWCLFFFSLSIVGQTISSLALRAFYALHDTLTPFFISIFVAIVNITVGFYFTNFMSHYSDWRPLVLNLITEFQEVGFFHGGGTTVLQNIFSNLHLWFTTRNGSDFAVGGLALGLGVAFLTEATLYLYVLHRKFKALQLRRLGTKLFIWFVTTIIAYFSYKIFDFSLDTAHTIDVFILASIVTLITFLVYFVLSLVLRVNEALYLKNKVIYLVRQLR